MTLKIKLATWNISTLPGKTIGLANTMFRRKVENNLFPRNQMDSENLGRLRILDINCGILEREN